MSADEQRVSQLCDDLLAKLDPKSTPPEEFLGAQYDLGLAWVHFAEGFGGLGLSPRLQNTINAKLFAAGAPIPYGRNPIGHGMCAPTIVTHGSDEQKQRYLRPLFTGEEIWCQMFSEPGAGSDVAGLSTRAVRDGDEWIVNGQKVWTTLAHLASFGIVLVEAMAAGTAVAASDLEAFRRVLQDGAAGALVPNGDAPAWSRTLHGLLDDADRRAALVRAGSTAVRAYDWPVVAQQVLRVYETVTAGGARVHEADE